MMEDIDIQLLRLLEENSRLSSRELSVMLNIPPEEVTSRTSRLENTGVLRRYSAVIDWEKTGYSEVSAVLELKVSPERDYGYDRIAERISKFRQVKSCRLMTGAYDLQVLVTGKDMQEVSRFVSEHIAPMDRIRETATHIIMKTYKENGNLFFEREAGERLPFSF